jgi:predicted nuclease of predicted toxin-antitoxin system
VRFKLDENLGTRGAKIFTEHGHDVSSVPDQGLQSADDRTVIDACGKEHRCLVTLDLDFSNPLVFPPDDYSGIAVLRLPHEASPQDLYELAGRLASATQTTELSGKLWIVQKNGIREYQPDN